MGKFKQIHIAQVWQTDLSHTIYRGILDYAKLRSAWELLPIPLFHLNAKTTPKWGSDGMIAALSLEHYKDLKNAGYPVVSTHASSQIPETFPQIDEDHAASGRLAAETLKRLGHEHFACIYSIRLQPLAIRAATFVEELKKNNIEVAVLAVEHLGVKGQEAEVTAWLKALPKPVALFASSDATARTVLKLCLAEKIAVPDDVAILGCQNDLFLCEGITPAISSIELPFYRIGYEAARTLDLMMQGKKIKKSLILLPPERIIRRASTDTLAVSDPRLRLAVRFIRDHVDDRIDVHAVAKAAGLSLRDLQRHFKENLNRTPVEEYHRTKVDRIKELLISTDLSLGEIAEQISFNTEHYLGSIFKRYAQINPGQFRKEHRRR